MGRRAEDIEKNQGNQIKRTLKTYITKIEKEKNACFGNAEKFGLWGQVVKSHENSIKAQTLSDVIKSLEVILNENS